jgi:recombination protein RecT
MATGNKDLAQQMVGASSSPIRDVQARIETWFEKSGKDQIANLLNGDVQAAKKLLAATWFSVARNPKLLECSPKSLIDSMMQAATLGLYPGALGECAYVPYKGEAQLQPMYKGLVRLAYDAGSVLSIEANVVYEKDEFYFEQGTNFAVKYRESLEDDRGRRICVYALIKLRDGGFQFKILRPSDITKLRAVSRSASFPDSPWNKFEDEMWKKSAIKAALKLVPLSKGNLAEAMYQDDAVEFGERNVNVLKGVIDNGMQEQEAEVVDEAKGQV